MARAPRLPLEKSRFDTLVLNTASVAPGHWFNLRYSDYAAAPFLFYASPDARFTPFSMTVPCLYLARSQETAFQELYGDRLYLAKRAGAPLIIAEEEWKRRVFVSVASQELTVLDLIDGRAGESIFFDAGTIWADDLSFPQKFAERICEHPQKVDGIRYRSRHTNEECVMIWSMYRKRATLRSTSPQPLSAYTISRDIQNVTIFGNMVCLAGSSP